MVERRDFECKNCGFIHENVWAEVKKRGHLYCPRCRKDPEVGRPSARM